MWDDKIQESLDSYRGSFDDYIDVLRTFLRSSRLDIAKIYSKAADTMYDKMSPIPRLTNNSMFKLSEALALNFVQVPMFWDDISKIALTKRGHISDKEWTSFELLIQKAEY
jgi:hypothetical protein